MCVYVCVARRIYYCRRASEAILRDVPFFLPFLKRVDILRQVVSNDGGWSNSEEMLGMGGVGVRVQVRLA